MQKIFKKYEPPFEKPKLSIKEKYILSPFFTNLDKSVYAISFLPPEVAGALCSRASRAKEDLRIVFLNEFLKPFLKEKNLYQKSLRALINFLHKYPFEIIFSNPKAREFYSKWLGQFGDDSIAQMTGSHLVFSSLSQIAIKHIEQMRIGIAPIEKSTRYVDFSSKIKGRFRYYLDPEFKKLGLEKKFKNVMDENFKTYSNLYQKYFSYLKEKFPQENEIKIKTKVLDTIRGVLPTCLLSQVAFFGSAQAFEYLINRSLENPLNEIRWLGQRSFEELSKIIPSLLERIKKRETRFYQKYLGKRAQRINKVLKEIKWKKSILKSKENVRLVEYDELGQEKTIASLIYPELHEPYEKVLEKVKRMSLKKKEKILKEVLKGRKFRWFKVPRAFETVYLKFEILTNIGAWRDLQRHRLQTLFRERFNPYYGYDVPQELKETNLANEFEEVILKTEELFEKIEKKNIFLSEYSVNLAHRIRFFQIQNLREFFWETELRTTPEGHPDYRKIEHQKIKILQKIYPLISKYLIVDMKEYFFSRR